MILELLKQMQCVKRSAPAVAIRGVCLLPESGMCQMFLTVYLSIYPSIHPLLLLLLLFPVISQHSSAITKTQK